MVLLFSHKYIFTYHNVNNEKKLGKNYSMFLVRKTVRFLSGRFETEALYSAFIDTIQTRLPMTDKYIL